MLDNLVGALGRVPEVGISFQTLTTVIGNRRRRITVKYMDRNGDSTITELSKALATHEEGPGYSEADRKRVYVSLYQNHLPNLNAVDIVDWSADSNDEVVVGSKLDDYATAIRVIEDMCS